MSDLHSDASQCPTGALNQYSAAFPNACPVEHQHCWLGDQREGCCFDVIRAFGLQRNSPGLNCDEFGIRPSLHRVADHVVSNAKVVTPAPAESTTPEKSPPGVKGNCKWKTWHILPDARLGSTGLNEVATTRTTTSPAAARGFGTSTISNCSSPRYCLFESLSPFSPSFMQVGVEASTSVEGTSDRRTERTRSHDLCG